MSNIHQLIPQREPFLFVDEIISVDTNQIIGMKTFPNSFIFAHNDPIAGSIIPGCILIEALMQCGGAGAAQLGLSGQQLLGLASLENVKFCGKVKPGISVKLVVKNLKVSSKVLKQAGSAWVDERLVLQAAWTCLLIKNT